MASPPSPPPLPLAAMPSPAEGAALPPSPAEEGSERGSDAVTIGDAAEAEARPAPAGKDISEVAEAAYSSADGGGAAGDPEKGDGVEEEQPKPGQGLKDFPDGGYGIVIVIANFLALFMSCGLQYAAGVYIRSYFYTQYFGPQTSYFVISFVGSLNAVAFPAFAPFTGSLCSYLGPRIVVITGGVIQGISLILASLATQPWQMLLSQGLMFGIGEVLVYMGGVAVIQQWFLRKRGLAIGLALSGSGFGGLAMSAVCQLLIDRFGFPWSLRIIGFLTLGVVVCCGALMTPRIKPGFRTGKVAGKRLPILDFSVFKNKHFVVFYVSGALSMMGYFVPFLYMSSYATSKGISASLSALALGLMNGASAVGRIIGGYAGDKVGYMNAFTACQLVTPVVVLCIWPFANTFGAVVAVSVLYGLGAGGYISVMPPMVLSVFGGGEAVAILGMQMSSGLMGSLAGPPIAGLITDSHTTTLPDGTKSIDWIPTIMYAGAFLLAGNVLLVWIRGDKTGWKLRYKI
ncbi:major facilitator superfamily domain-containing protein [Hyaloraphidium curvatum]|nr:major facilitator superfamily domain-containing protein [Hyaloraphidium curvatum]